MINRMLKSISILSVLALAIAFSACEKEDPIVIEDIENYTDGVVGDMQDSSQCGRRGCYEFVFPITINYPDGGSESVDDYPGLRDAIKAWREANPDAEDKPTLGFPLEVVDREGNIISVASKEELRDLRRKCRRAKIRHRIHHRGKNFCFKLVYPLSIVLPDDTEIEVANRFELKKEVRTWKAANPDSEERPSLLFPVTVADKDGVETEVASKEELEALKDACSNEGE